MLVFVLLFALWAVVHSIMASARFKAWVRKRMGDRAYDGIYRMFYNVFAVLSFFPLMAAGALTLPHRLMWEVGRPFNYLFLGIQLIALAGLVISLIQTDLMRFIGVSQLVRYVRGDAEVNPEPVLITGGTYQIVRHPLYFFSLLALWFVPTMTLSLLVFNIATTIYFWIGSGHEEKRLKLTFGERYEDYRRRVPRLLPIKLPM